jgi:site-specific DNA-methyltransferase (adenine-specific)
LVASTAETEKEARNVVAYMDTRFFRFLVSLRKVAQHNKWENFAFVPDLPMSTVWTDEALYARYGITDDEVTFIESMIRDVKFTNA